VIALKQLLYILGIPAVFLVGLIIGHFYPFLYPAATFGLFALYLLVFSPLRNKWVRLLWTSVKRVDTSNREKLCELRKRMFVFHWCLISQRRM